MKKTLSVVISLMVCLFMGVFSEVNAADKNSRLTCSSVETTIQLACPDDIPEQMKSISLIIGDLQNMQYKCRQSDCSNAQQINQALFLLNEAYKKYDIASEIDFSEKVCLNKDESYLDKANQKKRACDAATTKVDAFKSIKGI